MLSPERNEQLTRVGPGTLMGTLLREYWLPAMLSRELPAPDCDPVRILLLCERLVAFRDSAGNVGLMPEACPHRGMSLFFGRNEEGGLRCPFHGWKFDVKGQCVDMPCEAPDSPMRQKIRARAYPCVERGGVVWTYMGPRAVPPPLPELLANLHAGDTQPDATMAECNWMQLVEIDIDLDHVPVVHGHNYAEKPGDPGWTVRRISLQRGQRDSFDAPAGVTFGGKFPDSDEWMVGQFIMPFYSMLPFGKLGAHWTVARVPMDDENTMTIAMMRSPIPQNIVAGSTPEEVMFGPQPSRIDNTNDYLGRFRLTRNRATDFGFDRARVRARTGAIGVGHGFQGQVVQDIAIACNMGRILDRSTEHLGPGDAVLLRARKMLLSAADALASTGAVPPGVDDPGAYRVLHGVLPVPPSADWRTELARHRE